MCLNQTGERMGASNVVFILYLSLIKISIKIQIHCYFFSSFISLFLKLWFEVRSVGRGQSGDQWASACWSLHPGYKPLGNLPWQGVRQTVKKCKKKKKLKEMRQLCLVTTLGNNSRLLPSLASTALKLCFNSAIAAPVWPITMPNHREFCS